MSWNTSRVDQWMYKALIGVLIISAGLRLALGDTSAGAMAVSVGGGALLVMIPWLGLRWLLGEFARKSTEDKIVRDVRTYWRNPQPETPAAGPAAHEKAPTAPCDF